MQYNFEWDPLKAKQNIRKHKVSFQRAGTIFRDPHAISIFDEEHSQEEERWISLGRDSSGTLLVVSHTFHEIGVNLMKKEYDFSKGERGKFYRPDAELNFPIYLEPEIAEFIHNLAGEKDTDIETIVNDWLRKDIGLIQTVR